jgi:hypothetical protein
MSIISDVRRELSELKPKPKDLRNFGLVIFAALGVIAALRFWKTHGGRDDWMYFAAAALVFLLAGLAFPRALRFVYPGWMGFSLVLGWVMNRVILTITFVLVFTPIALILRIIGKDILALKSKPDNGTYWKKVSTVKDKERYRRPY